MLSVLIATRNRARILRDVLETFCHLQQPSNGWELIVIDNGSTDGTAPTIASFAKRLPLHTEHERELGKNRALNRGLELVNGDLVVFTDDDTFPCMDWLVQLRKAADTQPTYSVFGGPILPRWETPPPHWVRWVEPGPVYTLTDPCLEEGPIEPHLIFGPNMAIRASMFQSGARFDPSMGPRGSSYPMGNETELLVRLGRYGHKAWHVKGAAVEHYIQKTQLKQAWVMHRALRFGRGRYRLHKKEEIACTRLWMGVPRDLFLKTVKAGLDMIALRFSFKREAFFRSRWRFNFRLGRATEARILARERLNYRVCGRFLFNPPISHRPDSLDTPMALDTSRERLEARNDAKKRGLGGSEYFKQK
jgi:L-malate glycosyltransferase